MSHFRSLHRRQGEGHSFLLMQAITGCVHGARRKHAMQTVFIEQNSAKLATFMTSEYEGRSLKCCFGPLMIGISKRNFVYVCSTYECTRIRKKKKLLNYGFPEPYLPLSRHFSKRFLCVNSIEQIIRFTVVTFFFGYHKNWRSYVTLNM